MGLNGNASTGCANAVFTVVRNTPSESLNTKAFRKQLGDAIMQSYDDDTNHSSDVECKLEENMRIASIYSVHFLSLGNAVGSDHASIYTFDAFPGLFLVRNFLTKTQCEKLLYKTLTDYINPPSNSNLFQLDPKLSSPIWPSDNFKKLRWATIGHMYDWGSRSYVGYSKFPDLLVNISQNLLPHLDANFIPDAAIINCYTKGYFLRLHKDDAEETDDAVLNISLGAPGIFAVGGHDQSKIPVCIVVESGSVVVMAQDSRFCLHGIVKLLNYNKPGCGTHCDNIRCDTLDVTYAQPRLQQVIPQCADAAFAGVHCEKTALDMMPSLASELRVSVSIRRAKTAA